MNKTAQNLTWNCLPLEVKKEVKRQYQIAINDKEYYAECTLEYLFGIHNLTSDAEGEEMLTMSRKRVQELYSSYCTERDEEEPGSNRSSLGGRIAMLQELFGSKCLPDETCNVASSDVASNVASSKPNPSEPKFKDGDIASYVCSPTLKHKCTVTKVMQNEHSGKWEYNVMFEWGKPGMRIPESDLEPYTEPKASTCTETCTEDCSSQCKSQDFDNILKDSFRDHNRLHIAAMIMASMMQNAKWGNKYSHIARMACAAADTLLNEFKKGGMK